MYNPIMKWLLRSPLHGLISNSTMLITYTGRKSGRSYAHPVGYVRDGDTLLTTSLRERRWWRNLRGGAPVTLRVKGREVMAHGDAIADGNGRTAEVFTRYLRAAPHMAKYFQVGLDSDGRPNPEDVARAIQTRVMIQFELAH
jgi:hypothetical protein